MQNFNTENSKHLQNHKSHQNNTHNSLWVHQICWDLKHHEICSKNNSKVQKTKNHHKFYAERLFSQFKTVKWWQTISASQNHLKQALQQFINSTVQLELENSIKSLDQARFFANLDFLKQTEEVFHKKTRCSRATRWL
jgi:hypothetical protein